MKLINNEKGVSEIVGAMLILLILVIYLGVMQTYELPKWNKELEKQGFDMAYKDFLDLRSDIEDSSIRNMPVTSSMHTGVRYPERFMLSNPGQGAYGVFDTYPLKINISYNSNGTQYYKNYSSLGIIYQMNGISDFPKLVYEHGIIIKEFGSANYSDDENHIAKDNGIYIPILKGFEPLSSTEVETFNILPMTLNDITNATSSINVTFETRYPGIWVKMLDEGSIPAGSNITNSNTVIQITNIPGFNLRNLSLPNTSLISDNNLYSGIIRFADANTVINSIKINMTKNITNNFTNVATTNITNNISIFSESISCAPPGRYMWAIYQGCLDIPASAAFSKFLISNITTIKNATSDDLYFNVRDANNHKWVMKVTFVTDSNGILSAGTKAHEYQPSSLDCGSLIGGIIDLSDCYQNVTINIPNALTITQVQSNILSFKILVT